MNLAPIVAPMRPRKRRRTTKAEDYLAATAAAAAPPPPTLTVPQPVRENVLRIRMGSTCGGGGGAGSASVGSTTLLVPGDCSCFHLAEIVFVACGWDWEGPEEHASYDFEVTQAGGGTFTVDGDSEMMDDWRELGDGYMAVDEISCGSRTQKMKTLADELNVVNLFFANESTEERPWSVTLKTKRFDKGPGLIRDPRNYDPWLSLNAVDLCLEGWTAVRKAKKKSFPAVLVEGGAAKSKRLNRELKSRFWESEGWNFYQDRPAECSPHKLVKRSDKQRAFEAIPLADWNSRSMIFPGGHPSGRSKSDWRPGMAVYDFM